MSNIIMLYQADNISITWEYEFIPEVNEETHGNPESHSINAYISILINWKLKVFWISFPFKRYNFDSHQWALYINWKDAKTWDRYSVGDYALFMQFISIMQWMWYMNDVDRYLIDTWIEEFTKNKQW